MKRTVVQTEIFTRILDNLIAKRKLLQKDFEDLERLLVENPQSGEVIPSLSGLRKIRLKSTYSGKRGGFRVDYLDIPQVKKLYLVVIYPKNVKEDLSPEEKREFKRFVEQIKQEELKNG